VNAQCPHCASLSLVIDWPRTDIAYCLLCSRRFQLAGATASVYKPNVAVFVVSAPRQ